MANGFVAPIAYGVGDGIFVTAPTREQLIDRMINHIDLARRRGHRGGYTHDLHTRNINALRHQLNLAAA